MKYSVRFITLAVSAILLSGCFPKSSENQIRLYRTNSQAQQTKLTLVPGATEAGCHNLLKDSGVHRVAVLGFDWCEVYEKKDCPPESIKNVLWQAKNIEDEKEQILTRMTEGTRWVLNEDGNSLVRSFKCGFEGGSGS